MKGKTRILARRHYTHQDYGTYAEILRRATAGDPRAIRLLNRRPVANPHSSREQIRANAAPHSYGVPVATRTNWLDDLMHNRNKKIAENSQGLRAK